MEQQLMLQRELLALALLADVAVERVPDSYMMRHVRQSIYDALEAINETVASLQDSAHVRY